MIRIETTEGKIIKCLHGTKGSIYGMHPTFGLIDNDTLPVRMKSRKGRGHQSIDKDYHFQFKVVEEGLSLQAVGDCELQALEKERYKLTSDVGEYIISAEEEEKPFLLGDADIQEDKTPVWPLLLILLLMLLLIGVYFLFPKAEEEEKKEEEPIEVKIIQEPQKTVRVASVAKKIDKKIDPKKKVHRAIQQQLGFLKLVGRKDLRKALGGAPTELKKASAGAGEGGDQGSGGELLVGIGAAVSKTTVGNTGVKGLGGIGTKGKGGGKGGYGNTLIASGEGRGLSDIPLADNMALEGGLDRYAIQATIAKYLNQVRACYEKELVNNPGLTGEVRVAFEIGPKGKLTYSRVSRTSLSSPPVEGCITTRMMYWKFPLPRGGVHVKVNYPFLLRPVSS